MPWIKKFCFLTHVISIIPVTAMQLTALFVILASALVVARSEFSWTVLSPFNYPSKRIFPGVYTGGRLTETELKLLSQGEFASVLSVTSFPDNDIVYKGVEGDFPSREREQDIVTAAGLQMIQLDDMALDTASVNRFNQAILGGCHPASRLRVYYLLPLGRRAHNTRQRSGLHKCHSPLSKQPSVHEPRRLL